MKRDDLPLPAHANRRVSRNFGSFDPPRPAIGATGRVEKQRDYVPPKHWAQERMDAYRAIPSLMK